MTGKDNRSKLPVRLAIGVPAAIAFVLGFLWLLDYGAARNVRVEFQAKIDSITREGDQRKTQDSSTISKLQERLKTVEGAASSFQEALKKVQETLERIEAYSKTASLKRPKVLHECVHMGSITEASPALHAPPLFDKGIFSQTNYVPGFHDTLYQRPPVYYYYKMEYGQWPMPALRKPSWIGVGPSIGAGITRDGEFVTYLGIGINFNILRYRY